MILAAEKDTSESHTAAHCMERSAVDHRGRFGLGADGSMAWVGCRRGRTVGWGFPRRRWTKCV